MRAISSLSLQPSMLPLPERWVRRTKAGLRWLWVSIQPGTTCMRPVTGRRSIEQRSIEACGTSSWSVKDEGVRRGIAGKDRTCICPDKQREIAADVRGNPCCDAAFSSHALCSKGGFIGSGRDRVREFGIAPQMTGQTRVNVIIIG